MNIFVDTNVVAEVVLRREHTAEAETALDLLVANNMDGYISTQSFCTLIYLFERRFKSEGIVNPLRTELIREKMNELLDVFNVTDISSTELRMGVNDNSFTDLEDSCQYQVAAKAECQILLTFNIIDFKGCNSNIEVMTPSMFIHNFQ